MHASGCSFFRISPSAVKDGVKLKQVDEGSECGAKYGASNQQSHDQETEAGPGWGSGDVWLREGALQSLILIAENLQKRRRGGARRGEEGTNEK